MYQQPQRDLDLTIIGGKVKRTRKPWVYKSKYDILERRYVIAKWLAFTGWAAFIFTVISKILW